MKIPFDGKVNWRLVEKLYKDRVFYVVREPEGNQKSYTVQHGSLSCTSSTPFISKYTKLSDGNFLKTHRGAKWADIFESYEEAKHRAKYLDSLYSDGFANRPHIKVELLQRIKPTLLQINDALDRLFEDYKDFNGVRFCDVGANGIQIYAAAHMETLKYDLSNKIELLKEFISAYKVLERNQ